jgi:LysM repeat protein
MKHYNSCWFIFGFMLICLCSQAQAVTHYLSPKDSVILYRGGNGENVFDHVIKPKQTLYSLSKYYQCALSILQYYNPELEAAVKTGQKVTVPIPNRAIKRVKPSAADMHKHAILFYKVSAKETLYSIAKGRFKMSVEEVQKRNNLTSSNLNEGTLLHIGWIQIDTFPAPKLNQNDTINSPLLRANVEFFHEYQKAKVSKQELETKGLSLIAKTTSNPNALIVYFDDAPINSIIRISNPMQKRVVYAKVIGKIPTSLYRKNIPPNLAVSKTVATMLGVIDEQFYGHIKYLK